MEWEIRLWENEPNRRYGILFAAALAALLGWWMFQNPLMPVIGFLAIILSTTEYWLPIRFSLNDQSVTRRLGLSVTQLDFSQVKRVERTPDGIRLSPLAVPSRLDAFRGVFLRTASNQEEVWEFISKHIDPSCLTSGKTS